MKFVSNWYRAGWVKPETYAKLRAEIERLKAELKGLRDSVKISDRARMIADEQAEAKLKEWQKLAWDQNTRAEQALNKLAEVVEALGLLLVWADDVIKYDCAEKVAARRALATAQQKEEKL